MRSDPSTFSVRHISTAIKRFGVTPSRAQSKNLLDVLLPNCTACFGDGSKRTKKDQQKMFEDMVNEVEKALKSNAYFTGFVQKLKAQQSKANLQIHLQIHPPHQDIEEPPKKF